MGDLPEELSKEYTRELHRPCDVPVTQPIAVIEALFVREHRLEVLMEEVYAWLDTTLHKERFAPYPCAKDRFECMRPFGKFEFFPGQRVQSNIENVEACLDDMLDYDVNSYHCRLLRKDTGLHIHIQEGPKPGFRTSVWWLKHVLKHPDWIDEPV